MGSLIINGGRRLSGEIRVDAAKNSSLALLAARDRKSTRLNSSH